MGRSQPPLTKTDDGALRLDCLGLLCPLPIIETGKAIRRLAPGTVIEVLSDDPAVDQDLRDWCEANRHQLLDIRIQHDVITVRIRRRA